MGNKHTINYTVKNNLCTGCGICENICLHNSITITSKKGEYRPVINKQSCINEKGCNRCFKVCSGHSISLSEKSYSLFEKSEVDKFIGRYHSLYAGYSTNENLRYHSASGGITSQFLIFLLEKGIINGAIVTRYKTDDHLTPEPFIAQTKEDIISARSSKYCPVSMDKIGALLKEKEGVFVIVGLPCHIQGFRKYAELDKKIKEKIIGYFSIYCSSNRSFYARDYLFKKIGVEKSKVKYFSYRDNGCLGNMVISNEEVEFPKANNIVDTKSLFSLPYISYYGSLRSFFKPRRCLTCIDHYGELADVCFGDIHIPPYSNDTIGISSWIVRTPYFNNLFQQAVEEGYIKMDKIDPSILNESQKTMLYPKRRKAKALMNIDKIVGRPAVKYDITIEDKPGLKDYISVVITNIQRFVGRCPRLWFLIDWSNIRK